MRRRVRGICKTLARMIAAVTCGFFACVGVSCGTVLTQPEAVVAAQAEPEPVVTRGGEGGRALTIAVYMAADNDLEGAALDDLREMEAAAYDRERIAVLVLLDRSRYYDTSRGNWSDTRVLLVGQGGCERLSCPDLGIDRDAETERDMSDPETLRGFLAFCRREFPAEQTALVIWGHGTGWRGMAPDGYGARSGCAEPAVRAFAIDDESGSYMRLPDLRGAIELGMAGARLCMIGFDTCFGAELEVWYELCGLADWLCGNASVERSSGWDYAAWLGSMAAVFDGRGLALSCRRAYAGQGEDTFCVAQSSAVRQVVVQFDQFARTAAQCMDSPAAAIRVRDAIQETVTLFCAPATDSDLYADMRTLVTVVASQVPQAQEYARLTLRAIDLCVHEESGAAPLGVYLCDVSADGSWQTPLPAGYTNASGASGQCRFVQEATGYVPTAPGGTSFLDKLFGAWR